MRVLIFVGIVLTIIVGYAAISRTTESRASMFRQSSLATKVILVGGKPLTLELVTSTADVTEGLGDRDSMSHDHGMLFTFDHSDIYAFWMRHMRFSLDIIWLDHGTVVEIAHDLPAPKFWQIPFTYTPKVNADQVIEINAGEAKGFGTKIGQQIQGL